MSIVTYIDMFIGLALMYLVLSLFVSAINESIAQFTRLRARRLRRAILRLLEDPDGATADLVDQFYAHPLVKTLNKQREAGKPPVRIHPSVLWLVKVWRIIRSTPHFGYISPRTFAQVTLESALPDQNLANANEGRLRYLSGQIMNRTVRRIVISALDAGAKNADDVRRSIEQWFIDTMDRLSGWYTRTLRWMSLAIGLALVIILNVDSIVVANAFWSDSVLRESAVAYATERIHDSMYVRGLEEGSIDSLRVELSSLTLPVGWAKYGPNQDLIDNAKREGRAVWWVVMTHWAPHRLIGWLLTTLAISLGAHFWFDVLNKFVRIRSAGVVPGAKKQ